MELFTATILCTVVEGRIQIRTLVIVTAKRCNLKMRSPYIMIKMMWKKALWANISNVIPKKRPYSSSLPRKNASCASEKKHVQTIITTPLQ